MNLDQDSADRFARDWLEAWNTGDLPRVLEHYTDNFEMTSPFITKVFGEPSGKLVGKSRVEAYWRSALQKLPGLHFKLLNVFVGAESIALYYKTSFGKMAVEVLMLNKQGLVTHGFAHYVDENKTFANQERAFDHVDLRVPNLEVASLFNDQIMPSSGFPISCPTSHGVAYESKLDHSKQEFVGLIEDQDHRLSATRIAFRAFSKEAIERAAEVAVFAGAHNVEGPLFCQEYFSTYYAVFFDDPCGNHLEVCCRWAS